MQSDHSRNSARAVRQANLAQLRSLELQHLRRTRLVAAIVAKQAPRLWLELFSEIGREHGIFEDLDRRLERYAELDAETLRILGVDKLPLLPLRAVVLR